MTDDIFHLRTRPGSGVEARESEEGLTPTRVARLPLPGTNVPTTIRFSPDGAVLSFLFSEEGTLTRQLWVYDPETDERKLLVRPPGGGVSDTNVSREEALRRERQRQRGFGVTTYAWAERGRTLLVPIGGAIYVQKGLEGELREVVAGDPPCIDPQLNADGSMVAFVRQGELHVLDLTTPDAVAVRLTFDASPPGEGEQLVTNGLAEFVAQEEMGRQSGFWWSPDGRFIAFEQVDNGPVTAYPIVHQGEDRVEVETHRYPFAGEANANVRLGFLRAAGGQVTWLPLPGVAGNGGDGDNGGDGYLARVLWTPDGCLLVQMMSRDQRRLELRRIDPFARNSTTLLVETAADWVNLHDDLRCVPLHDASGTYAPERYQILWSSERSGRERLDLGRTLATGKVEKDWTFSGSGCRQLYLYDREGKLLRQLTSGSWPVDAVVDVDDVSRTVWFLGADSPLERHLWRVSLDGGEPAGYGGYGFHSAVFAPDHQRFVDVFSSLREPPALVLRDITGQTIREIFRAEDPEVERLGLEPPGLVTVRARDGALLYGALYRPPQLEPGRQYPVIVEVYGGPHVQLVTNDWSQTVDLRAQYLARQGFVVFKLDNRGSARRGHAFEAALFRQMGSVEVQDQADGVRYLATLPYCDTERCGVYGWSYGGYLTIMCLLKAPEVFKAGVAGAPVTSWDGYDTFYTERYMETPATNPDGYAGSAAMTHAGKLRGKLLLLHGMLDENVHFRHTARLVKALNEAGKPYELAIFPGERHGPRDPAQRAALERRIAEFFKANL